MRLYILAGEPNEKEMGQVPNPSRIKIPLVHEASFAEDYDWNSENGLKDNFSYLKEA